MKFLGRAFGFCRNGEFSYGEGFSKQGGEFDIFNFFEFGSHFLGGGFEADAWGLGLLHFGLTATGDVAGVGVGGSGGGVWGSRSGGFGVG